MKSVRKRIKISTILLYVILTFSLFVLPVTSYAQDVLDVPDIQKELENKQKDLEALEALFTQTDIEDPVLIETRRKLKELQERFSNLSALVKPLHVAAQADLADLGTVPEGENAAQEPENIQALRVQLTDKALLAEGVLRHAEASHAKTSRLLERLASLRRNRFVNQVLENQLSLYPVSAS